MMKQQLAELIKLSLETIKQKRNIVGDLPLIKVDQTKDKSHGDFASNIALVANKLLGGNPRELAEAIISHFPQADFVEKIEIAGPGFINFFLIENALNFVIQKVLLAKDEYGLSDFGKGKRVLIEYVSANPTGPLHVGHGRGAVYGSTLANLLKTVGYYVESEYYVNDAGRQMHILASSVWLRYLNLCKVDIALPKAAYQGDYIIEIAKKVYQHAQERYKVSSQRVLENLPPDEGEANGDKEMHIDALIERAKSLLGDGYNIFFQAALNDIIEDIKEDLQAFGVSYNTWFSEQSLYDNHTVEKAIDALKAKDFIYEKDGAIWFKSSVFNDEKDRVLVRENGQFTYFAPDIAYHMNKLERGFDWIIDVWGADHHGYVPRIRAAMQALGADASKLSVPLVQFATLYRNGMKVQMSTRSGSFVTVRELREEVGNDAARFFYIMRKADQHMDFDLDLAKSKSNENPVYYIQYAHARIAAVMRQLEEKGWIWEPILGENYLDLLSNDYEKAICLRLTQYPDSLVTAAKNLEPHIIANYLKDLANDFHSYYNACQFLDSDVNLRNARLNLINAVQQVLRNGLNLLGVSAPGMM